MRGNGAGAGGKQIMSILRSLQSLYTQVYAYEDQIGTMHRVVSRPPVTTTWTVVPPSF
jgi:hypothetical protein